MTTHAIVLPRVRFRRPPSSWRIFWLMWLGLILDCAARVAVEITQEITQGKNSVVWHGGVLLLWIYNYARVRHNLREHERFNRVLGPVPFLLWCLQIICWLLIGILPWFVV